MRVIEIIDLNAILIIFRILWWEVGDGVGGEDGLYLAFPDGEDGVAKRLEGGEVAGVSLFVGGEFGLPEVAARSVLAEATPRQGEELRLR